MSFYNEEREQWGLNDPRACPPDSGRPGFQKPARHRLGSFFMLRSAIDVVGGLGAQFRESAWRGRLAIRAKLSIGKENGHRHPSRLGVLSQPSSGAGELTSRFARGQAQAPGDKRRCWFKGVFGESNNVVA